jgi:hypothetical protein
MDLLAKLFGSAGRLKMLRLFVFNRDSSFTMETICSRTNLSKETAREELASLVAMTLLRKKGEGKNVRFQINHSFEFLPALTVFIRDTTSLRPKEVIANLKRAGTLQLVVLSGHFTGVSESQIDLLVVGDNLEEKMLVRTVRALEAEFGREVRYASFSTEDFRYRLGVYDRLLRDVFDYPHRLLLDKIGL